MYPCPNPSLCGVRQHRRIENCRLSTQSQYTVPQSLPQSTPPPSLISKEGTEEVDVFEGRWANGNLFSKQVIESYPSPSPDISNVTLTTTTRFNPDGVIEQVLEVVEYEQNGEPKTEPRRKLEYHRPGVLVREVWSIRENDHVIPKPEGAPTEQRWHSNGQLSMQSWHNENDKLHRDNAPAEITWYESGQIESESWYQHGSLHREDNECAQTCWHENGQIESQLWLIRGEYSRTDGGPCELDFFEDGSPSYENYTDKEGQLHRVNGPAVTTWNRDGSILDRSWFLGGTLYSEKGFREAAQAYIAARESGFTDEMSKAWAGLG